MRGISWLAAKPVSFSRRTLLHAVSNVVINSRWWLLLPAGLRSMFRWYARCHNDYTFTYVDAPHTRNSVGVNFEIATDSRGRSPLPKLAVTTTPSCWENRMRRCYQQTIPRPRKEFSWMVGMRALGVSHALPSALSHSAPSALLQPAQNARCWREVSCEN
jgi:hypothetical protein